MLEVITLPETLDEALAVIRRCGQHRWTRERYEEAVRTNASAVSKVAAVEARIIGVDGAVGLFTAWLVVSDDAAKRAKK